MVAVHTQSAAQCDSLAGLAVNDSVIARRFYSGQFDFKKRDAVGLDTAQPHSRTTKVNLVHVVERMHRTLLRGGSSFIIQRCGPYVDTRNTLETSSGATVEHPCKDGATFALFSRLSMRFRLPSPPLRTCLLQLLFPRVGHDANPRLSQPANHLAKFDQFLIGHEAQTFAQLLQLDSRRFKCDSLQV